MTSRATCKCSGGGAGLGSGGMADAGTRHAWTGLPLSIWDWRVTTPRLICGRWMVGPVSAVGASVEPRAVTWSRAAICFRGLLRPARDEFVRFCKPAALPSAVVEVGRADLVSPAIVSGARRRQRIRLRLQVGLFFSSSAIYDLSFHTKKIISCDM